MTLTHPLRSISRDFSTSTGSFWLFGVERQPSYPKFLVGNPRPGLPSCISTWINWFRVLEITESVRQLVGMLCQEKSSAGARRRRRFWIKGRRPRLHEPPTKPRRRIHRHISVCRVKKEGLLGGRSPLVMLVEVRWPGCRRPTGSA